MTPSDGDRARKGGDPSRSRRSGSSAGGPPARSTRRAQGDATPRSRSPRADDGYAPRRPRRDDDDRPRPSRTGDGYAPRRARSGDDDRPARAGYASRRPRSADDDRPRPSRSGDGYAPRRPRTDDDRPRPSRGAGDGYAPRRARSADDDRPRPARAGEGYAPRRPRADDDYRPRPARAGDGYAPRRPRPGDDDRPARAGDGYAPGRPRDDDRPRPRPARAGDGYAPRRPRAGDDDRPARGGARRSTGESPGARGRSAPAGSTDRSPAARTGAPRRDRDRDRDPGFQSEARRAVARARGRAVEPEPPTPKGWGGVARRGARVVGEPREGSASQTWRETVDRDRSAPAEWEPEVWVREPDQAQDPAPRPIRRQRETRLPEPVKDELTRTNKKLSPKLEQRLAEAVRAYERDRYQDARRMLRPLAEANPDVAAIRELHGLTLYRMNRWSEALKELDAFHALTGSHDQHPVLMDCNRALKRWKRVEELWGELRAASPGADLVAEGRIVAAGALADRGRVAEAIALLDKAPKEMKRPRMHHLRTWYALADLYERAGEIPRARTLFANVLRHDREFADVGERLAALG